MSAADLKPVKINGELFWNKWMSEFNTAFNSDNNRYECTIGNMPWHSCEEQRVSR
jgi:hypothetical protein